MDLGLYLRVCKWLRNQSSLGVIVLSEWILANELSQSLPQRSGFFLWQTSFSALIFSFRGSKKRLRNNLSCEYWGVFLQSSPRHRFTLLKIFEQKLCKTSIYMYSSASKGLVFRSLTTSEWVVYAGPSSDRTWVLVYRYRLETLLFYYCLDRWSATN